VALTDAQLDVVNAEGNFLLLACPGSGKTRAAAARVMKLVNTPRKKVAACSYTNVGAERIASMLDQPLEAQHFVGTVHMLLLRYVVYPFAHLAGAQRGPELRHEDWPAVMIYGDHKQRVPLDDFRFDSAGNLILRDPPRAVKGTVEEILASAGEEARRRKRGFFQKAGMLSADDAMWVALKLLRDHPELARAVATRFDELLIDEAQDTSELQLACVAELKRTGALGSLVLIGDLEQSIFSFQGASAAACRALADDHELGELTLSENHRCSQKICNAAAHFCAREEPDRAVGDTCDCEIDPELALYPPSEPERAMTVFRERLDEHGIDSEDAAVLARRRTMVEALAGTVVKVEMQERPERVAKIAVGLAEGTLTRTDMRYAERTVARCAFGDEITIEELADDLRGELRNAAYAFISHLPVLGGDLRTWTTAAKEALQVSAGMLSEKPATAAGMLLKSKTEHAQIAIAEIFTPPARDLVPQTVHSIKGEDREAVMMVVRKPHHADPTRQFELFDAVASGAAISVEAEEERRVTFVALTRARRYCLVALPDTPRGREIATACSGLGFARI
jgi:DNA helicase II / ATP-dependent DNA helicase PcrA